MSNDNIGQQQTISKFEFEQLIRRVTEIRKIIVELDKTLKMYAAPTPKKAQPVCESNIKYICPHIPQTWKILQTQQVSYPGLVGYFEDMTRTLQDAVLKNGHGLYNKRLRRHMRECLDVVNVISMITKKNFNR